MARVKVVLGFVVLAAMFKYSEQHRPGISNALPDAGTFSGCLDCAVSPWRAFTCWVFMKLEGMTKDEPLGVGAR